MSDAYVVELDALAAVRTGLFKFGSEAEGAVVGALQAAASVVNEVAGKEESARAEVRRCAEIVAAVENALRRCLGQEDADCSSLEAELGNARRLLERKLEILRAVQATRKRVEESVQQFGMSARRMRGALAEHIDVATNKLQTWANVLEAYATGSVAFGTPSSSPPMPSTALLKGWATASTAAAPALAGPVSGSSPARSATDEDQNDPNSPAVCSTEAAVFASVRWKTARGTMILIDDSTGDVTDEPHETVTLDSVADVLGAGPGMLTAVVYRARDGEVSRYERDEPGKQWLISADLSGYEVLGSTPQASQPGPPPRPVTVVQVSKVELPGSFACPSDDEDRPEVEDICVAWRRWEETVAPAVQYGAGRNFFRLLDAIESPSQLDYQSIYEAMYCEDPIQVEPSDDDCYVVIRGWRRVLAARRLGLHAIPVVVVTGAMS